MTERWLLRLHRGDERVTLEAWADPEQRRRAMVHAGGYAISHLEVELRPGLAAPLRSLVRGLTAEPSGEPPDWIGHAAASQGLELTLLRRITEPQPLPFWPVGSRRGDPRPGSLWPFDAERVALEEGLRALIRREGLDETAARAERAYFESHGLRTRYLGAPHGTLVVARTDEELAAAEAREARNVSAGDEWARAARDNGIALGYPTCCVDAFVQIRARDELTLLAESLPPPAAPPAPALAQWLNGSLTVLSHAPCRPDCAATLTLARATMAALERRTPGLSDRFSAYAARLHLIDVEGGAWALELDERDRVRHALRLEPTDGAPDLTEADHLCGGHVRRSGGELSVVVDGVAPIVSRLFADHRAR